MVTIEKYHGTGNDFVVVDASEDVPHRRAFANDCCDRDDGITHPDSARIGADGVLFLALEPDYRPPRVVMTLVQPDGSVAAMCGNGARCAATWAARRLRRFDSRGGDSPASDAEQTGADEVMIDTPSGTRHATIHEDSEARSASGRTNSEGPASGLRGGGTASNGPSAERRQRTSSTSASPETRSGSEDSASSRTGGAGEPTAEPAPGPRADGARSEPRVEVTVEMGTPRFAPEHVPLARDEPLVEERVGDLAVTAVDTGVPHAVAFVDDVDAADLEPVAPPIRDADVFPEGANVTVASPVADGDGFRQRTFERGVETETDSCGTGAVAVAAVAHRLGRVDASEPVRVAPPGGDLHVTATPDGSTLRGPVVREFRADVEATEPARSD